MLKPALMDTWSFYNHHNSNGKRVHGVFNKVLKDMNL